MSDQPTAGDWDATLADLRSRKASAQAMGKPERLAQRAAAGKLNARERIAALTDAGSFTEVGALTGPLPADAFVAGLAQVDGRPVAVGAEDFTVAGGSIGRGAHVKRYRIIQMAVQERIPLVMLLEGAGHRPPLPSDPPATRSPNDLQAQADASGLIPMATAVLGPSAGHGALSAPLADFTVMTRDAAIFAAGPPLVKAALGEEVSKEELGGPAVALASGLIHNLADDDQHALDQVRRWLSHMPSSAWHRPLSGAPITARALPEILDIVPRDPRRAYDMRQVIHLVFDDESWFEVQPHFGPSLVTGLAHLGGQPVAVVANQPAVMAGTIDADAADKAAQFVGVADSFHLPLIFLTDNPGVLAGSASERAGILKRAGRMFAAQHQATVPKIQLTLRKAYGFGSSAMSMNPWDNQTLNLAWPGVTFGAMPARGADAATGADEDGKAALLALELSSGYRSANGLSIDDLIEPADTQIMLRRGLAAATNRLTGPVEPKRRTGNLR